MEKLKLRKTRLRGIVLVLLAIFCAVYYRYTWILNKNDQVDDVLQVARSIVVTLPKEDIKALEAMQDGAYNPHYLVIINILKAIIRVNPKAKFAYIYTQQNGKTTFLADSRSEDLKIYSPPPGQAYLKTNKAYEKAINGGKEYVTAQVTDKWGTWISVFLPIKDESTGRIIAAFGIDFDANTWNNRLIYEMAESTAIILLLLTALFVLFKVDAKNNSLQFEITERQKAELALLESNERLNIILENNPIAIWDWNIKTDQWFATQKYYTMLGYDPENEYPDRTELLNRVHSDDRESIRTKIANVLSHKDENYSYDVRMLHADGNYRWHSVIGHVIERDEDGKAVRMLGVRIDVTEQKQADEARKNYGLYLEETVKRRTVELESAKERAESADKLKSAFLVTMSHELRTPLNSIIGFSGILMQEIPGPLNSEQKKQLGMVQSGGRQLLLLINDILDLSKIEAGQMIVSYESFNIQEVIEDVIKLKRPSAKRKGLSLSFAKTPEIEEIESDKQRIHQVLFNLLDNAVKFTNKGSVSIGCYKDNNWIKVEIADTGIGIKEENLAGLFTPFIQIDNELTREHQGSGLGLSISKKLIDLLQGTIHVKSEFGVGTTFTITLPLAVA